MSSMKSSDDQREKGIRLRSPDRRRIAFQLQLRPGSLPEYRRRHQGLWPEMSEVLRSHGVHHYVIYHDDEASRLFAYVELEDLDRWRAIGETEVGRRWRRYMSDLLETDDACVPVVTSMNEVFCFPGDAGLVTETST